jgi:hypothetical protein
VASPYFPPLRAGDFHTGFWPHPCSAGLLARFLRSARQWGIRSIGRFARRNRSKRYPDYHVENGRSVERISSAGSMTAGDPAPDRRAFMAQPARRSGSTSDPARCRVRHHHLRPAHSRRHACPTPSRSSWGTCLSRIGILLKALQQPPGPLTGPPYGWPEPDAANGVDKAPMRESCNRGTRLILLNPAEPSVGSKSPAAADLLPVRHAGDWQAPPSYRSERAFCHNDNLLSASRSKECMPVSYSCI